MKRTILIALFGLLGLSGSQTLLADDRVSRYHEFDLDGIEEVEIEGAVGSIEITPSDDDEIHIALEIESNHRTWWGGSRVDVENVDLDHRKIGKRLVLEMTEKDTNADWHIRLPAVVYTRIEMGVGSIEAEIDETELRINLGVGEVHVSAKEEYAGRIDVSSGVGDARIRGAQDVDRTRAFISASTSARGQGRQDIHVKVGVGDASVHLR